MLLESKTQEWKWEMKETTNEFIKRDCEGIRVTMCYKISRYDQSTLHTEEEEKKCILERQDNVSLHPYDTQVHTLPLLYKGARL